MGLQNAAARFLAVPDLGRVAWRPKAWHRQFDFVV